MIAACELAPPPTETAPASPASASRMRSAGSTSRRTRMNVAAGGGAALGATQVVGHGLGHLADVARALGQVRVGQRGQQRGLGLAGLSDRVRAVGAGPDRLDAPG